MIDQQAREQLLSCLEYVKLDLEEIKQHSSAVMVGQAIELIEAQQSKLVARHQLLADIKKDLLDRAHKQPDGTYVAGVGSSIWNRLQEALSDDS